MKIFFTAIAFALSQSAAAQPAPATLREVMRINGATEDITGQGLTTQVLRDNRIAYFDHGTGMFIFFDSTGKRVGKFGGPGEGPGEFGAASGRTYSVRTGIIGDTLWAHSVMQRRFTVIGPDLKLVRTFLQPPFVPPVAALNPMAALSGDRLLARADFGERVPTKTADGRETTTWKASDSGIVVLAKDGAIERRVMPMPPSATSIPVMRPGMPVAVRTIPVPFRGSRLLSHSRNGEFIGTATSSASGAAGTFTVTVTRSNGEKVYTKSFPYAPVAVTKRMYDSAWARVDSSVKRLSPEDAQNNPDLLGKVRDMVPTTLAPFRELQIGFDGTVWLRKALPNDVPAEYVAIDPSGALMPPIHLKKGLTILTGTRSTIWATESDADGFLSVVRFAVGNR